MDEGAYDILVWCLPGAKKARIVVYDEEGTSAARTVGLAELKLLRDGVQIAIDRIMASIHKEHQADFCTPSHCVYCCYSDDDCNCNCACHKEANG